MLSHNKNLCLAAIIFSFNEIPEHLDKDRLCVFFERDGKELPPHPADTEEAVFDHLRYFAESFPFTEAAVFVTYAPDTRSDSYIHMCAIIRGIFRAAVYGKFSLVCVGVQTSAEYENFRRVSAKLFCELEEEDREFNGYIEKGALISTPLGLEESEKMKADIVLLDIDSLIPRVCGKGIKKSSVSEKEALEKMIAKKLVKIKKIKLLKTEHRFDNDI